MERISDASPRLKARVAGLFYLFTATTGFGVFVRGKLVVDSDAVATTTNILAHEPLFRLAFLADLLVNPCFVILTLLFYDLFKPVSRGVSLLAAFFSLAGCAIASVVCLFELAPLIVLGGGHNLSAFGVEQLQALALLFLKLHAQGVNISLIFFGSYCLLIGYLIFRSTFLPRILGALMAIAGLSYLTNSFATLLAPAVAAGLFPYILAPGGVAEVSLILWLLVIGVNASKWREQASTA